MDTHLYTFEAVVQEGTIHAAAAKIHLTQTAVTQRIKALERKLDTTLFIRSRKGMQLTPEGEALYRYCQQITELNGQLFASIRGLDIAASVRIRFIAPTSIMRARIIPACGRVMKQFPHLMMSFEIDDSTHIPYRLKSGEADFAIMRPEQLFNELAYKTLRSENYLLLGSTAWRDKTLAKIVKNERIIDFEEADHITYDYLKAFSLFNDARKERHFVNNTESLAYLISSGHGYGVLAEEFAKPYIEREEMMILNEAKAYEHKIVLCWYPRVQLPTYFKALMDAIE